jgi:putative ABC transport system permease protein
LIVDVLHAAWYAVASNRVRTLLTAASVAVGVCSVVFMSSMARSSLISLASGLEAMGGAQLVAVFPKKPEGPRARYATGLTMEDVDALRRRIPFARWISVQTALGRHRIEAQGKRATADVVAGDSQILTMLRLQTMAGRPFTASDDEGKTRVALLAEGVAALLFSPASAAVGHSVRIGSEAYSIVGVLGRNKRFALELGFEPDKLVLVSQPRSGTTKPDRILVGTVAKDHNKTVGAMLTSLLGARHHQADDFRVFDFAEAMERFQSMLHMFELLAGAIASVALLAGAAGTTNVLMVSVHEQVREIGVRKALGATGGMIVRQFVLQGTMIAGLGAVTGVGLGLVAVFGTGALVAHSHEGWVTVAALRPTGVAVACAFLITAMATLFPALKVKRMSIVESLRARG